MIELIYFFKSSIKWFENCPVRTTENDHQFSDGFLFFITFSIPVNVENKPKIEFILPVRYSMFSALIDNPCGNTKFWILIILSISPSLQYLLIFVTFSTTLSICLL